MSSYKELLLTQMHLQTLPVDIIQNAVKDNVEYLDLSNNRISNLRWLQDFKNLRYLILDCNRLRESHLQQIEMPLETLKVLMLNKNEFSDLNCTASLLAQLFPNLSYLSLHGNPLCPDGLNLKPFSQYVSYDYEYYLSRIVCAMPKLKFLDHASVHRPFVGAETQSESRILTCTPKMWWTRLKATEVIQGCHPLPSSPQRHVGYHSGYIRKVSAMDRVYNGTESEGNRFISNSDL